MQAVGAMIGGRFTGPESLARARTISSTAGRLAQVSQQERDIAGINFAGVSGVSGDVDRSRSKFTVSGSSLDRFKNEVMEQIINAGVQGLSPAAFSSIQRSVGEIQPMEFFGPPGS